MARLAQTPTQVWQETEYGYKISEQLIVDYDGFEDIIEDMLYSGYELHRFLSDEIGG